MDVGINHPYNFPSILNAIDSNISQFNEVILR